MSKRDTECTLELEDDARANKKVNGNIPYALCLFGLRLSGRKTCVIGFFSVCSCGRNDHSRTSSKKCPKYHPRQALVAKEKDAKEKTATVKMGLKSFLAEPALEPIIQDAIRRMTSI